MTVHALVLAGGTGTRFGAATPKQLLDLDGRSVLAHAVSRLAGHPDVDWIVLVTHAESAREAHRVAVAEPKVVTVVSGGATRADSTRLGLAAIPELADDDLVLVHDAARPLVTGEIVDACLAALADHDAVTPAVESVDTLVEVDSAGLVVRNVDRSVVRRVQTPQGFRAGVLRRAHAAAALEPGEPTDDCGVVLAHVPGARVTVVPGDERNLKITRPADLDLARRWLHEG
ncbi:MAG: 2-C-methyl-D-erythritol 4-phosphate cytidylyltransferase [Aeromicrobium sp.]|uniref:2-C-methyl-D-erythritol 4-phosphate cytidylyltransferase n=1 Tax=Aeromicrobium sp. TaxID=1871063 RepID=UPI0025BA32CA|nr:2-C-methyl-D-erythritol 4-phosphate cytidylyltransferase [Aeromicrobium sp.]MCK5892653.1 2-C-methyl-D-erythritol 4-phosphate cytidylyltransferase [Aeromicrobium sp.]MDF1703686.1 2-C-methyl-D-erythritol 4-phosphate cytidylyltransferase [Aeromicrobium sp.]